MDRSRLPYRKNCEVYVFKDSKVLAKKRKGYLQFPGGGVDEGEDPKAAVIRETREETGVALTNVCSIAVIRFDWSPSWAQTEKQKRRYNQFRGEEMHLFTADIKAEMAPNDPDDMWCGVVWLDAADALEHISGCAYDPSLAEYRQQQLAQLTARLRSA